MKRLLKSETLTAIISIAAATVSILAIGSEFIKISPDVINLLVSIVGVIVGVIASYSFFLILNKRETAKIFISYSLKDTDFVLKLSNDLSRDGFQVLRLDNVVMVGDNIQDKILESIEKADFFITIISNESLESEWVARELKIAEGSKKKVFPVLKDDVPLPPPMQSIQYADFTKEYNTAISALVKSLRASVRTSKTAAEKSNSA
jgi:hypothetical protein